MKRASSIRSGFFSASVILSEPAKSIRLNFDTSLRSSALSCATYWGRRSVFWFYGFMYILTWKMVCERELDVFLAVCDMRFLIRPFSKQ